MDNYVIFGTQMDATQPKKLWKDALNVIQISLSKGSFSTWFSNTFIASIEEIGGDRLRVEIGCPSSFIAAGIEKRYFGLVQDALQDVTSKKCDVSFVVKLIPRTSKNPQDSPLFSDQVNNEEEQISGSFERVLKKSRIRPGFTFENFAVSNTNQMAHAAAEAVANNPGGAYNPLFLYGGVGVGKTHLMLAVAHKLLGEDESFPVLYCMGEEFTSEIVEAIRTKSTQTFKNRYRSLKLLMVDDVQFIAGKNTVQEEFFHTFNTIQREGGQVILTSDRPPSEIQKLEERLRNRFEAGLIIDISPPDFELLSAIALIKGRERGVELPMDIAQTIASNIESPRKIEGFITRLFTETQGFKEPITSDLVLRILGKTNTEATAYKKAVLPQDVVNAVSNYYSVGKRALLGESRTRPIAEPRQILMYLLRIELGLPLQEVGRLVGGRDHTTVMHAVNKISSLLSTNDNLRSDLLGIKQQVSG